MKRTNDKAGTELTVPAFLPEEIMRSCVLQGKCDLPAAVCPGGGGVEVAVKGILAQLLRREIKSKVDIVRPNAIHFSGKIGYSSRQRGSVGVFQPQLGMIVSRMTAGRLPPVGT